MLPEQIDTVRAFNRLVTQRAGALEDHFLGRDRPLGESRVLYEIGSGGVTLRAVRTRLGLDSGYLSRLVRSLASKGLVEVEPGPEDERVRVAHLTEAGLAELDEIDRRSDEAAAAILSPLSESQRRRLTEAMGEVVRLLRCAGVEIAAVDPSTSDARWCLARYFEELGERFEGGFDPAESLVPDLSDLLPPHGVFLVATVDGRPVACGAVVRVPEDIGYIKRMWVDPSMRGLGLGRRLLRSLEASASELGCTVARLETNRVLEEAIELYRSAGYREVRPFNQERYAHHWFEKGLGEHSGGPMPGRQGARVR